MNTVQYSVIIPNVIYAIERLYKIRYNLISGAETGERFVLKTKKLFIKTHIYYTSVKAIDHFEHPLIYSEPTVQYQGDISF